MIRTPKIGKTYWVSGDVVHAKDHVAQATVNDYAAEENSGRSVYVKLDTKLVPPEFRASFCKGRYHSTVLSRRDLHSTMRGAIEAIRSSIFKRNVRRNKALADLQELEATCQRAHWEASLTQLTTMETSTKKTTGTRSTCRTRRGRKSPKS